MTAAARPQNKVDLLTNVPIRMSIKYIDVFPNDTSKNQGKGYGASMRFKGTIDGADAVLYPRGAVWAAVKALKAAGVIAESEYDEDPSEKYSIAVRHSDVELCMKQNAGERYASFTVTTVGAATPVTTSRPHNTQGAHIPGIDDSPFPPKETGAPPQIGTDGPWNAMLEFYERCLTRANSYCQANRIVDQQAIVAMTATLFIEANKRGLR